ncbi:MAG: RNA-guided endonuclease InsQ/TnpB family protein, partial [Candidatus Kariarchaeaceae archaeon]
MKIFSVQLTLKNTVRGLDKLQYKIILQLTHNCKNLYNYGLYIVRQSFIHDSYYINYENLYDQVKEGNDYRSLPSQVAQQVLKLIHQNFRSFFSLLAMKKLGQYSEKIYLPGYLPKQGHFLAIFPKDMFKIQENQVRLSLGWYFSQCLEFRYLYFKIPHFLLSERIKIQQIRLLCKYGGRYIEIEFVYTVEVFKTEVDKTRYLGIDLGLNNFASCYSTVGTPFILEGKGIKSFNRWWNKEKANLQSTYDKQKNSHIGSKLTHLLIKRKNVIRNFIAQNINYIRKFCTQHKVGAVVIGDWQDMKRNLKLAKKTSQLFQIFPFGYFKKNLKTKLALYNIKYIETEESNTSQTCSNCRIKCKSNRKYRGLYV